MPLSPFKEHLALVEQMFLADRRALWRALEDIAERPHRELIRETPRVVAARVDALAPHLLGISVTLPGAIKVTERKAHFLARGERWRYIKVLTEQSRISYDTLPNQLVAHFIRTLLRRLRVHEREIHNLDSNAVDPAQRSALLEEMRVMRTRLSATYERCDALRNASTPQNLTFSNLALTQEPRYARVLQAYMKLTTRTIASR